jgi:xanthine dehydrogenase small subunit
MSRNIHFILNNQDVISSEHPGILVLDYLRRKKKLVGTKEGCKEGDCGACTILIGELVGGEVKYNPVTSCLVPLGELHGKHLVTIEGINVDTLSPIQQAIVDEGATQCGFCTPGIVVSLTHFLMEDKTPITREKAKVALSGHLCRCTGYRSLKQGVDYLKKNIGRRTGIHNLVENGVLPKYFMDIPSRLKKIPKIKTGINGKIHELFIAGGTDIYLQKGESIPDTSVRTLNLFPQLKGIMKQNGTIRIGALTNFEEFSNHPEIRKIIPEIKEYMFLIASLQIRNRATLGGNIINASPIGDMTILLLALDSNLVFANGNSIRTVPMKNFYKGYKVLDKKENEILTHIEFKFLESASRIHFEKVSKRKCLDIASVNSAIKTSVQREIIRDIGLAMGGVAPVPLYMRNTCDYLINKEISHATVSEAIEVAQNEISPISDIRGSAEYKRLLVRQLMIAHFCKLFPEKFSVKDFFSGIEKHL